MGERNWQLRYRIARDYADEQARLYQEGKETDTYRGITGAAWVAEAYDIAVDAAESLVNAYGTTCQPIVDTCKRIAQEYRQKHIDNAAQLDYN